MNPKKSKEKVYVTVLLFILYSIHVESSCRKPEIQNHLPKITKIKCICYFLTNSGQKSLTMFISSCFNKYSIEF